MREEEGSLPLPPLVVRGGGAETKEGSASEAIERSHRKKGAREAGNL